MPPGTLGFNEKTSDQFGRLAGKNHGCYKALGMPTDQVGKACGVGAGTRTLNRSSRHLWTAVQQAEKLTLEQQEIYRAEKGQASNRSQTPGIPRILFCSSSLGDWLVGPPGLEPGTKGL